MIRSALKAGLKKVVGRVMGVTAPPPPPPAPTWVTPSHDAPAPEHHAVPAAPAASAAPPPAAPSDDTAPPDVTALPTDAAATPAESTPGAPAARAETEAGATRPKARRSRAKKVSEALAAAVPEPAAEAAAPDVSPDTPAGGGVAEGAAAPLRPTETTPDDTVGPPLTMEALQEVIDEMVRPALQGDGGDITLLRIEGRKVYVRLVGACSTCPSSIVTLKMGVEALLKEEFPSLEELVQEG